MILFEKCFGSPWVHLFLKNLASGVFIKDREVVASI